MAKHISNKLANAIRDYAYAKGEFQKQTDVIARLKSAKQHHEELLREIEERLTAAQQCRDEADINMKEANRQINELAPNITEKAIRGIVNTPKTGGLKWGEFKKELIAILLANQGTPVPTKLFIEHFSAKYAIPKETRQQRYALSQRILRRLEEMAEKGVISRRRATEGRREVYWLWIGL
ncbi:hypothetical protein [Ferribacterium limneticum]|uniref:hypothetical protein n=1 Tax=Ferribacterium limneticum TaxID=76259 RepID=UPI001CF80E62|nr:hypothetical protein [Ferribacterium limneticum]UCV22208.1 hypothetical protein KI613_17025 [Ferribacterium limneticum]